ARSRIAPREIPSWQPRRATASVLPRDPVPPGSWYTTPGARVAPARQVRPASRRGNPAVAPGMIHSGSWRSTLPIRQAHWPGINPGDRLVRAPPPPTPLPPRAGGGLLGQGLAGLLQRAAPFRLDRAHGAGGGSRGLLGV